MAIHARRTDIHQRKPKLPKKWTREVLKPNLSEIHRLITLKGAHFSSDSDENEYIKNKIKIWLTNITNCVDAIEETLPDE